MAAFFWAGLGFFVLAALVSGAYVGLRGWHAWQAFTSLAAATAGGIERLLSDAERVTLRAERTAERGEDLLSAVERLKGSVARAGVLLGAAGEAGDLLRAVRAFVPRK